MGDQFGFPYGTGASTRAYGYATALHQNGARVKVLCVEPSESPEEPLNTQAKGVYAGIEFEYTYGRVSRPTAKGQRLWLKATKWGRFVRSARDWAVGAGGLDAIIVYSRSLTWIAAAAVACRATGALFIHEDCELPFVWRRDNARTRRERWLYEHVAFKAFDGCLVISTYLQAYCSRFLRESARALLVPIIVDVSQVTPNDAGDVAIAERVSFCGSLDHPEVLALFEAFAAVADDFPDVRLQVIGAAKWPRSLDALHGLAGRLGITQRIEFAGQVKREDLFDLLRAARLLVLPRPAGAFSQAGLPTKVGEYLATGRPVVVTAVGDLPLYLRDGVDAYLAPPDDVPAFAERLRYALSHQDEATAVGRRGRETARERFDPRVHGARILAFIEELERARAGSSPRPAVASRRDGR